MEIQMISREIGEYSGFKLDAIDPVQGQSVRRNLHHSIFATSFLHLAQQTEYLIRFRRGSLGGQLLAADKIGVGAHQAHLFACRLLQYGFNQHRDSGFAIGARNADHLQILSRMMEKVIADFGQRQPGIAYQRIGDADFRRSFTDNQRGAFFHSLGNVLMSVCAETGHRHKNVSGLHLSGIIADACNFHILFAGILDHIHIAE